MSHDTDRAIQEWIRDHHGIITAARLDDLGLARSTLYARASRGLYVQMCSGVWRSSSHADDQMARMAAACFAGEDVAIGFTTAGRMIGLRGMQDPLVHAVVPHGCRLEIPGVVVHQTRELEDCDKTIRGNDGLVYTTPPRTLLDAASLLGVKATESAVEQALNDGQVTFRTLLDTLDRLYHPHRPGATVLRAVLVSRPAWRRAARSELEIRVRRAIDALGMPAAVVNYKTVVSGQKVEFDLAWPERRVALEVDHPYWHGLQPFVERDAARDLKAMAAGWYPCRVSESDVDFHLHEALGEVAAVLAQRAPSVA